MNSYQSSKFDPNSSDRRHEETGTAAFQNPDRTIRLRAIDVNLPLTPLSDTQTDQSGSVTIHIVDHDALRRAQVARLAFVAGFHAEIYADSDEFIKCTQRGGVILCFVAPDATTVSDLASLMIARGDWLPIVAFAESLEAKCIVETMRMGAMDFLVLPLDVTPLRQTIDSVSAAALKIAKVRSREAESTLGISKLSSRERQVLSGIASGKSNKTVARDLGISPRTVEIHRMKMMTRLGVKHVASAMWMWFLAGGIECAEG